MATASLNIARGAISFVFAVAVRKQSPAAIAADGGYHPSLIIREMVTTQRWRPRRPGQRFYK